MPRCPGASLKASTKSTFTKSKRRASTGAASHLQSRHQSQIHHRVSDIAMHIPWYGFRTQARIARDSLASESAVSRLLNGHSTPSLLLALRLTAAMERRLKRSLPLQELFSLDGHYPTPSACELCGCRGCVPPDAYDDDRLRPAFASNSNA